MLCREIMGVCCDTYTEHGNTLWALSAELVLSVAVGDVTTRLLLVEILSVCVVLIIGLIRKFWRLVT
jgi:hypothetical protein